jgi:hypothetical protein
MGQRVTKTGVDFDTISYRRVKQEDGSYLYFKQVSYAVLTDEEDWARTRQRGPLAGAARNRIETEFTQTEGDLKTLEGIP